MALPWPCHALPCQRVPASEQVTVQGLVSAQRCWKRILLPAATHRAWAQALSWARQVAGRQWRYLPTQAASTGSFPPPFHSFSLRHIPFPTHFLPSFFLSTSFASSQPPTFHPATPSFLSTERGLCWGRKHPLISFACVCFRSSFLASSLSEVLREFENLPFRSDRRLHTRTTPHPFRKHSTARRHRHHSSLEQSLFNT